MLLLFKKYFNIKVYLYVLALTNSVNSVKVILYKLWSDFVEYIEYDSKYTDKKKLRKAASAVAGMMLLFLLFSIVYEYVLLYGINIIFNKNFSFSKAYYREAVIFFYTFLPNMVMIVNFTIQILSLITSVMIVSLVYKFKPIPFLSKKISTDNIDFYNNNLSQNTEKISIFKLTFIGFCITIALNFVISMIINALKMLVEKSGLVVPEPDLSFKNNSFANLLVYSLALFVFAPLIEEFLIRGCVLKILKPFGNRFAIIISAAFFALLHGNIVQGAGAFIIGLILGYVTVKSNSLLPAIIIHALNNFLSFLAIVVVNLNNYGATLFFSMIYIAIITLGVAFFFLNLKKMKIDDCNMTVLSKKETYTALFTTVLIWIYLAYELFRFLFAFYINNK